MDRESSSFWKKTSASERMCMDLARKSGASVMGDVCKETVFGNAYELQQFVLGVLANEQALREAFAKEGKVWHG